MQDETPARPRFSVVIPTCRRNDSLAACLDQLRENAQAPPPPGGYEVIVADDGPDGENAQRMVAERYPGVRWVAGPRHGPAANRNRGAAEARGLWLVFTDDDCLPEPGWLAAYAARLDQKTADGPAPRVLEGPTTAGEARDFGPFMTSPQNDSGGYLWSCNFAIERALFEEMGGFDAGFPHPHLEDVDMRLRLQDRGETFPFVRDAVVVHPPRPVRGTLSWVESQESAFYLARKRGESVAGMGAGFGMYLRSWVHLLRSCRNAKEAAIASARMGGGLFLIACRWPFWKAKYRT